MNRRSFLCSAAWGLLANHRRKTKHLILIVNGGGCRKKEYYEDSGISPRIRKLASEGFVFEQDHCEQIASHDAAFNQLVGGFSNAHFAGSLSSIPEILRRDRPALLVCRTTAHDAGHESFDQYLSAVRQTDSAIGRLADWINADSYFTEKTAIVIRPEFGRDDEINAHGQLHHSYGFYYTHRVAGIFWGPDFNRGVDRTTIVHSVDMAPALAKMLPGVVRSRIARPTASYERLFPVDFLQSD